MDIKREVNWEAVRRHSQRYHGKVIQLKPVLDRPRRKKYSWSRFFKSFKNVTVRHGENY